MSLLDTSLLAGAYSRGTSTAVVSDMTPANGDIEVAPTTTHSVDVIGIPDTADTEILLYLPAPGPGTVVIYSGGAFGAAATAGTVVLSGGVYTFEFDNTTAYEYSTAPELGVYDIGAEIGYAQYNVEADPELLSGWLNASVIEPYFGMALTKFPNMNTFLLAFVAASVTDPGRTEIAYKRCAELLFQTELGDILVSRNDTVTPHMTGQFRSVSTSTATLLAAATRYQRAFQNGMTELELYGLDPYWLGLIRKHIDGASFAHKASAISLALHLAIILEHEL